MAKSPTKKQRDRWERIRALGCIVPTPLGICGDVAAIHHCFTGMGGRKDHDKVIPLCHTHHQGSEGIHTVGRPIWQLAYGTEAEMIERLEKML